MSDMGTDAQHGWMQLQRLGEVTAAVTCWADAHS